MSAAQQWMDDGDGGSMAPQRNESLDRAIESFLASRTAIANHREAMKEDRNTMAAIMHQEGIESYEIDWGGVLYRITREDVEEVHISKVRLPPGVQ